ncbi:unnamed protein product [Prunus armeniaca]
MGSRLARLGGRCFENLNGMLKNCSTSIEINFLRYKQLSQCKTMRDSSVSYASAAAKVDA